MDDLEQRMLKIEARHEIENRLGSYVRGIDRLDLELLKTVFHADGINHSYDGDMNLHDWCDAVIPTLIALFSATMHHITHKNIEISGDEAVSESYFIAWHQIMGTREEVVAFFGESYAHAVELSGHLETGHEFLSNGRYLHKWEKRDGAWRVVQRTATLEWNYFYPRSIADPGSRVDTILPLERRDRSDPVYALFASLAVPRS